jgi:hypothetical protein
MKDQATAEPEINAANSKKVQKFEIEADCTEKQEQKWFSICKLISFSETPKRFTRSSDLSVVESSESEKAIGADKGAWNK